MGTGETGWKGSSRSFAFSNLRVRGTINLLIRLWALYTATIQWEPAVDINSRDKKLEKDELGDITSLLEMHLNCSKKPGKVK